MTEQDHELAGLAALAAQIPEERRRMLESQAPSSLNPRFDAGFAAGLAHALQIVQAEQGGQAVGTLQEVAAVVAARVLWEQRAYAEVAAQWSTPEHRAEIEAQIERIRSGQENVVPVGDIQRLLDEMDASLRNGQEGA